MLMKRSRQTINTQQILFVVLLVWGTGTFWVSEKSCRFCVQKYTCSLPGEGDKLPSLDKL